MKKKILWMLLSFLLVAALMLASCAEEVAPGEQEEEEEEEEEPEIEVLGFPRHETLFISMRGIAVPAPDNFNRWPGWRARNRGIQQVMEMELWLFDLRGVGDYLNLLAAGPPEYNEDFTQLTIELREGMYWSDGVEFTADDVVFTVETTQAPGHEVFINHGLMLAVKNVYAVGKYTVVIELYEPDVRFHLVFASDVWGSMPMFPKHVFENVEDITSFEWNPPLSLGQYVLHSYDPAGFWTAWERREDWDRTPTGVLYGKPEPRYVVYVNYGDATAEVIAMSRNELDTAGLTFPTQEVIRGVNPYARAYREEFPYVIKHSGGTGFNFNCMRPPLDNKDVRWALTLSIDIVDYIIGAYKGSIDMSAILQANDPLSEKYYQIPMIPWLKEFTLDIGDGETFKPYDPDAPLRLADYARGVGHDIPTNPTEIRKLFGWGWWKYAPEIADRLLMNLGFSRDADGWWLLPDGTPWKIQIVCTDATFDPANINAFALQRQWRKFGIDATVLTSPLAGSILVPTGDFDVNTTWAVLHTIGPNTYKAINNWHSEFIRPLGEMTWGSSTRWSHPRMEEIRDELRLVPMDDVERMVELGLEAHRITIEEMPGVMTVMYPHTDAFLTKYWTNWPFAENAYCDPYWTWSIGKAWLPRLEAAGQ